MIQQSPIQELQDAHDKLAKIVRHAKALAKELTQLEDGKTVPDLSGYARGSYFTAKAILAVLNGETK